MLLYIVVEVKPTKKFFCLKFGPTLGPKLGVFFHLLKFGSLVFLEIAYNDNLQQCMICSRGKTQKLGFLPF